MNTMLRWIATVIALALILCRVEADTNSNLPNIPANEWESHPEGIALALTLTSASEKERPKSFITIYLKNISNTTKEHVIYGGNWGFNFSTLDSDGQWHPSLGSAPFNGSGFMLSNAIKPGETLSHEIAISSTDLALLKTHSVKCSFLISDPTTKQNSTIESTPKLLTETVVSAPSK